MKNQKYKKGEGTASTFLIASLIGITLLVVMSTLIIESGTEYGATGMEFNSDNQYFQDSKYDGSYNNITQIGRTYADDYDPDVNETGDHDRFEDLQFWKAFKIVGKLSQLTGSVKNTITGISSVLRIPSQFVYLIILILAIVLITGIIKVIRGFNNV